MSLMLGVAILYWMYRDFDFRMVQHTLLHEMNWWWMLASFPFCVIAQAFRGLRWKQLLEPLGEKPRTSTCIRSIYVSYAASLLVPRVGEFTRCGVLAKKDGVSFAKALGTVVTERVVDSLIIMLIVGMVFLFLWMIFGAGSAEHSDYKRFGYSCDFCHRGVYGCHTAGGVYLQKEAGFL